MRPPYLSPPPPEALLGLQLHELARDFPELLELFRSWGVDWPGQGTAPLKDFLQGDACRWQAIQEALAWREAPGAAGSAPGGGAGGGSLGSGDRRQGEGRCGGSRC